MPNTLRARLRSQGLVFLDDDAIEDLLDKKERRAMLRIGLFIKTNAQRRMRPGGKSGIVSQPGEAPRYHSKQLRKTVSFAFDTTDHTLFVGPLRFDAAKDERPIAHNIDRPNPSGASVLEFGGDTLTTQPRFIRVPVLRGRNARRRKKRKIQGRFGHQVFLKRGEITETKARPYMQPAMEEELTNPRLREAWSVIG